MKHTNVYEVAGHQFAVTAEDSLLQKMEQQYGSFHVKEAHTGDLLFCLKVVGDDEFPVIENVTEEILQDEDFVKMRICHMGEQSYFEFLLQDKCEGQLLVSANYQEAVLNVLGDALFSLNNAAMLLYALTTARMETALFHSSVVEHQGRAYMFLGKSGTGKSTHSRLWLHYIEGTQLVNDDNPIVRIDGQGHAIVYGSPWSGKTPCYRNVSYPINGIVKLDQAPENRIQRLKGVEAYAAIVTSVSGKRWDKVMAEGLHQTECRLVENVPIWHLDCRPDEEAAAICFNAINSGE